MEASERPQLPLDGAAAAGSVRALDDRLVIERLEVADPRAARLVRERAAAGRPTVETVRKAIEIGSRVLDSEETAANVDYVRRELEAGLGELDRRLGGTLEEGAEAMTQQIAAAFGAERNDSVQAQIREIVTAESRQHREELLRRLGSEDAANPLVAMQVRIGNKLVEAEAAGTRKGLSFEDRVHDAIASIAGARGDLALHTGSAQAEGGGKKGDTLVEIGGCEGTARGRVVFEAKDNQLTKNKAWSELNAAMTARAASFGVLVVAGEDNVPAGREALTEYEGNKLIVAVDRDEPGGLALGVAYRLAVARVAMTRDRDLTVDAVAVRDAAAEAVSTLKQAQAIRSALTGVKTQSDRARDGLDAMVDALESKLAQIDSLVAEAEAE